MPSSSTSSSTALRLTPGGPPVAEGRGRHPTLRLLRSVVGLGLLPERGQPPRPPETALRLRRAVLMLVVFGAMGLLAYAMWQRMAHAGITASPTAWHEHP